MGKAIKIPKGLYLVGRDIPVGVYLITSCGEGYVTLEHYHKDADGDMTSTMYGFKNDDRECRLDLEKGDRLILEYSFTIERIEYTMIKFD